MCPIYMIYKQNTLYKRENECFNAQRVFIWNEVPNNNTEQVTNSPENDEKDQGKTIDDVTRGAVKLFVEKKTVPERMMQMEAVKLDMKKIPQSKAEYIAYMMALETIKRDPRTINGKPEGATEEDLRVYYSEKKSSGEVYPFYYSPAEQKWMSKDLYLGVDSLAADDPLGNSLQEAFLKDGKLSEDSGVYYETVTHSGDSSINSDTSAQLGKRIKDLDASWDGNLDSSPLRESIRKHTQKIKEHVENCCDAGQDLVALPKELIAPMLTPDVRLSEDGRSVEVNPALPFSIIEQHFAIEDNSATMNKVFMVAPDGTLLAFDQKPGESRKVYEVNDNFEFKELDQEDQIKHLKKAAINAKTRYELQKDKINIETFRAKKLQLHLIETAFTAADIRKSSETEGFHKDIYESLLASYRSQPEELVSEKQAQELAKKHASEKMAEFKENISFYEKHLGKLDGYKFQIRSTPNQFGKFLEAVPINRKEELMTDKIDDVETKIQKSIEKEKEKMKQEEQSKTEALKETLAKGQTEADKVFSELKDNPTYKALQESSLYQSIMSGTGIFGMLSKIPGFNLKPTPEDIKNYCLGNNNLVLNGKWILDLAVGGGVVGILSIFGKDVTDRVNTAVNKMNEKFGGESAIGIAPSDVMNDLRNKGKIDKRFTIAANKDNPNETITYNQDLAFKGKIQLPKDGQLTVYERTDVEKKNPIILTADKNNPIDRPFVIAEGTKIPVGTEFPGLMVFDPSKPVETASANNKQIGFGGIKSLFGGFLGKK